MKSYRHNKQETRPLTSWRRLSVVTVFMLLAVTLLVKTLDMQILRSEFFEQQGDARQLRTVSITAHRGDIVDRNGEPFAVSAPVNSIWVNPKVAKDHLDDIAVVAKLLSLDAISLKEKIKRNTSREFLYLKRHASPELADEVMALKVPGVALLNEYRRYYPSGEVAAHVIGFSDIDDNGQEGVELAFDDWLKGHSGKKRVIRDRLGRAFDDIERIKSAYRHVIHASPHARLQSRCLHYCRKIQADSQLLIPHRLLPLSLRHWHQPVSVISQQGVQSQPTHRHLRLYCYAPDPARLAQMATASLQPA